MWLCCRRHLVRIKSMAIACSGLPDSHTDRSPWVMYSRLSSASAPPPGPMKAGKARSISAIRQDGFCPGVPWGILPVPLQRPATLSYRGNDSTFYRPPSANQLTRYLTQIPENFEMCFKVWEEVTIPRYARHARYGMRAGQLESELSQRRRAFSKLVLQPFRDGPVSACTRDRSCLSFSAHGMAAEDFSAQDSTPSSPCSRETLAMPWRSAMRACWAQPIIKL